MHYQVLLHIRERVYLGGHRYRLAILALLSCHLNGIKWIRRGFVRPFFNNNCRKGDELWVRNRRTDPARVESHGNLRKHNPAYVGDKTMSWWRLLASDAHGLSNGLSMVGTDSNQGRSDAGKVVIAVLYRDSGLDRGD